MTDIPPPSQDRAAGPDPADAKDRPPGYAHVELLQVHAATRLYRAWDETTGRTYLLEVVDPRHGGPADLERLHREYEIGVSLQLNGVARPIGIRSHQGAPALAFEDWGGEPLDRLFTLPLPLSRFLDLSLGIAGALAELHTEGVVHKDIKPQNILVHPVALDVKLIGLGLAARVPAEQLPVRSPDLVEGSLPYMSPEQTGHTSVGPDSRSDLYSLGATLYQLITGRLLCEARDPLEWLHFHVAQMPVTPSRHVTGVPDMVSRIIMRLLAKSPEDRYQTARGLQADLTRCREAWRRDGRIEPFALAEHDVVDRLQFPQKPYGREAESAELLGALARVAETGISELVVVSGSPGVGKTLLAGQVEGPTALRDGHFVIGKADPYQYEVPYSTLARAFGDLVVRLAAAGDEASALWRQRVQEALGATGRLVTEVIPAVELLVGAQPAIPDAVPAEARTRFRAALRRFASALAVEGHPLVLFLDDLQWADPDSLPLLQDLVTDPEVRFVLVVTAYRDNEVGPTHPLALALDAAQEAGGRVTRIALDPLPGSALTMFVADTLHCPPREARTLAGIVQDKTAGNPFFSIQFLTQLHNERLLRLDPDTGSWCWDVEALQRWPLTDSVAELMVSLLKRLPAAAQDALTQLAFLGSAADLQTLSCAVGGSPAQVHADLRTALASGFVAAQDETYSFTHDLFREAAYALVPEEVRPETHLRIGRLLVSHLQEGAVAERVFEVANQFDRALPLITDPPERDAVRRWNVQAASRAKQAVAYASAAAYLGYAAELLAPDAWSSDYQETFDLQVARCECLYLSGDVAAGEVLCDEILTRAGTEPDRATIHRLRIRMCELGGRNDEAMTVAAGALRPFGLDLPDTPEDLLAAIEREEHSVTEYIRGRRVADFADAPAVTDPELRAALGIIADSLSPAYMAQRNHFPLLAAMGVNLCLRHGHTVDSSSIYNSYALERAGVGDFDSAFDFSDLALRLLAQVESNVTRGIVLFRHGFFVNPWRQHLALSLPYLERSESACIEGGDLLYAAYARFAAIETAIELGNSVDGIAEAIRDAGRLAGQANNDAVRDTLLVQRQFVSCLKGLTREPGSLEDTAVGDLTAVAGFATWRYLVLNQVTLYLFGRYDDAFEVSVRAGEALRGVVSLVLGATHHFYRALTLAALYPSADGDRRAELRRDLDEELRLHEQWANHCRATFENRYALVAAEAAGIDGRELEAERLYEQAIRSAREHGFVHHEALAYERAAAFQRARGLDLVADTYLREARACYLRWGATAKVRHLEERHPQLAAAELPAVGTLASTFAAGADQLDLLSVIRASQTISAEITVGRLVETLLEIVVHHSGAGRAGLLLEREGSLIARAEALFDGGGITTRVLPAEPADPSSFVPGSVLRAAAATRQPVILDDRAVTEGEWGDDPYFARHRPRSLLALPILRGAEVLGILYLENDLVAGAFMPSRLAVLELLAAQAAISLETAHLYTSLEQLNSDLTQLNADLQEENAQRARAQEEARQLNHQLAFQALHDDLTGLPNRALLMEHVQAALARAQRSQTLLGVLFIDLDDFKAVNDTFGHVAADGFLVQVGQRISASLRETDKAARVGGDEFVVVCEDLTDAADVALVAQRIRAALSTDIPIGGHRIGAPASIGIAVSSPGSTAEDLLRDADTAMYQAKRQGGRRWELADTGMWAAATRTLEMETALREAISGGQLLVHYQPTVDLDTCRIVGVEALLRWQHPTRGLVLPQDLVLVAERRNLIGTIGDWVLQTACRQAGEWADQYRDAAPVVSVNVSSRQLGGQVLPERVEGLLAEVGLPPQALCLEVTETQFVSVDAAAVADLVALQTLGAGIAVDDFGTGFAGFDYLRRLPVTRLKIDRSYVHGLGSDRADTAIVASVITLARNLDLATTAEGIETVGQRNLLRQLGCTEGQGWLWHPAMPASGVERLIRDQQAGTGSPAVLPPAP